MRQFTAEKVAGMMIVCPHGGHQTSETLRFCHDKGANKVEISNTMSDKNKLVVISAAYKRIPVLATVQ
jgi:hypothetical protein